MMLYLTTVNMFLKISQEAIARLPSWFWALPRANIMKNRVSGVVKVKPLL